MSKEKICPTCGRSNEEQINKYQNLSQLFRFKGSVEGVKMYAWTQAIGAIFGIGFMIFMFTYGPHRVFFQKIPNYGSDSRLSIQSHRDDKTQESIAILGRLKNEGEVRWSQIDLKAEFFDSSGNFIDECYNSLDIDIIPKSEQNFKFTCSILNKEVVDNRYNAQKRSSNIEHKTPSAYSKYDIRLVGARAYRESPF